MVMIWSRTKRPLVPAPPSHRTLSLSVCLPPLAPPAHPPVARTHACACQARGAQHAQAGRTASPAHTRQRRRDVVHTILGRNGSSRRADSHVALDCGKDGRRRLSCCVRSGTTTATQRQGRGSTSLHPILLPSSLPPLPFRLCLLRPRSLNLPAEPALSTSHLGSQRGAGGRCQ